jgi:hypothetical protein
VTARSLLLTLLVSPGLGGASSGAPPDFWPHWSDNRAEMNGYRLVQPRYGADRAGTAVLIYVTEDFSDSLRVKADPRQHPTSDVYPVLKLNASRDFRTGIYEYNVMTSTFARVAPGWPIAKVSFSSQEWCGNVYHQLIPRGGRARGIFHSYFDGEADGRDDLPMPDGGVLEDAVPILVRGWMGDWLPRGATRTLPFLPSLLRSRLEHRTLAWGEATVTRASAPSRVTVPAGTFQVDVWTIAEKGGRTVTYSVESAPPYRLVRWTASDGEEASLLGSDRLRYWEMNGPGEEKWLKNLGLMLK